MDIIDVMLARALTPEGQADSAAAAAQRSASEAYESMGAAVDAANEALTTLQQANEAVSNANSTIQNIETTITNEIDKLAFSLTSAPITNGTRYDLLIQHEDLSNKQVEGILRLYDKTGDNTNGTMTQRAITNALNEIRQNIISGGGSTNLGQDNAGKIVVVGEDGNISVGTITEDDIVNGINNPGGNSGVLTGVIGLEIDYANKSFKRIQEAVNKQGGVDFDSYAMYGGRKRCNVADDGTINAWYGDNEYKDDGSNGQVMIYQPKFYYSRTILEYELDENGGKIIRKEQLVISPTQKTDFKIHPLFIAENGEELDYVLISAYEGSAYRNYYNTYDKFDSYDINFNEDKLSSIASAKPISGVNKALTPENAEKMAKNRGAGWHITNLAFESLEQMLCSIEYGTLNGQSAIELGIVNIPNTGSYNCASLTGSTGMLGNATGAATNTINEINGVQTIYNDSGRRAISYRGLENPWGNMWRIIGGLNIYGDGAKQGGIPYICTNYNYNTTQIVNNYLSAGFELPNSSDWISAFGLGNTDLDWAFIPIECYHGNSALPIGDNCWTITDLSSINEGLAGGSWSFSDSCGLFYYGFDRFSGSYAKNRSARLMFIPTPGTIYYNNIEQWNNKMGV